MKKPILSPTGGAMNIDIEKKSIEIVQQSAMFETASSQLIEDSK